MKMYGIGFLVFFIRFGNFFYACKTFSYSQCFAILSYSPFNRFSTEEYQWKTAYSLVCLRTFLSRFTLLLCLLPSRKSVRDYLAHLFDFFVSMNRISCGKLPA